MHSYIFVDRLYIEDYVACPELKVRVEFLGSSELCCRDYAPRPPTPDSARKLEM